MKKVFVFTLAFMLFIAGTLRAENAFNFDSNSEVDLADLIYFISWLQAEKTTNSTTVVNRATEIYSLAQGPLTRVPDDVKDDLDGDGVADLNDLILMIAWLQAEKTTSFSTVVARAKEIYSNVDFLSKLPGTPIGDSSFTTTITGITTDP
jgi:hypothetical protein